MAEATDNVELAVLSNTDVESERTDSVAELIEVDESSLLNDQNTTTGEEDDDEAGEQAALEVAQKGELSRCPTCCMPLVRLDSWCEERCCHSCWRLPRNKIIVGCVVGALVFTLIMLIAWVASVASYRPEVKVRLESLDFEINCADTWNLTAQFEVWNPSDRASIRDISMTVKDKRGKLLGGLSLPGNLDLLNKGWHQDVLVVPIKVYDLQAIVADPTSLVIQVKAVATIITWGSPTHIPVTVDFADGFLRIELLLLGSPMVFDIPSREGSAEALVFNSTTITTTPSPREKGGGMLLSDARVMFQQSVDVRAVQLTDSAMESVFGYKGKTMPGKESPYWSTLLFKGARVSLPNIGLALATAQLPDEPLLTVFMPQVIEAKTVKSDPNCEAPAPCAGQLVFEINTDTRLDLTVNNLALVHRLFPSPCKVDMLANSLHCDNVPDYDTFRGVLDDLVITALDSCPLWDALATMVPENCTSADPDAEVLAKKRTLPAHLQVYNLGCVELNASSFEFNLTNINLTATAASLNQTMEAEPEPSNFTFANDIKQPVPRTVYLPDTPRPGVAAGVPPADALWMGVLLDMKASYLTTLFDHPGLALKVSIEEEGTPGSFQDALQLSLQTYAIWDDAWLGASLAVELLNRTLAYDKLLGPVLKGVDGLVSTIRVTSVVADTVLGQLLAPLELEFTFELDTDGITGAVLDFATGGDFSASADQLKWTFELSLPFAFQGLQTFFVEAKIEAQSLETLGVADPLGNASTFGAVELKVTTKPGLFINDQTVSVVFHLDEPTQKFSAPSRWSAATEYDSFLAYATSEYLSNRSLYAPIQANVKVGEFELLFPVDESVLRTSRSIATHNVVNLTDTNVDFGNWSTEMFQGSPRPCLCTGDGSDIHYKGNLNLYNPAPITLPSSLDADLVTDQDILLSATASTRRITLTCTPASSVAGSFPFKASKSVATNCVNLESLRCLANATSCSTSSLVLGPAPDAQPMSKLGWKAGAFQTTLKV